MTEFWDDPMLDYRQRWRTPEHFEWDPLDLKAIDYEGYVRVAIDLLPPAPCHVLDVGCGDGWVAQRVVALGYDVTGVDYSDRAVGFARVLVPDARFEVADARDFVSSLGDDVSFTVALCIEVLEHIPHDFHRLVLENIRLALEPGGVLVLSVPSTSLPRNRWHYKHFELDECVSLLSDAGFSVDEVVRQHVRTVLSSRLLWRAMSNRAYDIRFLRRAARRLWLQRCNTTPDVTKPVGRYVIRALRSP